MFSQVESAIAESYSHTLRLVHRKDIANHPGTGRIVDAGWVDDEHVREWIGACDANHPECKRASIFEGQESFRPRYLIDVVDACIVEGSAVEAEYIALSYQWGQASTLRTSSQIRHRLMTPGALSYQEFGSQMPQTVKDAIAVSRCLNYRYLWVDAICCHDGRLSLHKAGDESMLGIRAELVAVCKGHADYLLQIGLSREEGYRRWREARSLRYERYHERENDSPLLQATNCYFVLWIEWKDGVAYRKASGAVLSSAWERLREKEPVDLILG
ncbi:HET-domain-containing protein [Plenodomus tracheiphilus IPT5]|uniref:HET-domain-containing protein n=1 Tax=Plenodomus tracheiphilus IPT5 TaxID=1408161 RepID=A0A6A7AYF5_9PLEO|nr:HET-domain-containing protein [Plenodomus tracheiphilus IPT5]